MFAGTSSAIDHCVQGVAERILDATATAQDADRLFWRVLQLLNANVPDDWALTRQGPNFVVRVMKSREFNMARDMLIVGSTSRPSRASNERRLYHLVDTVLDPTMICREGRRATEGILGTYVPEEFGRALANRPNLYVFLERPPFGAFHVWAREEVLLPFFSASEFQRLFKAHRDWETALASLYEVHAVSPITALGPARDVVRFLRLCFDGSVSSLKTLPSGCMPSFHYRLPPVKRKDLGDIMITKELLLHLSAEELELEAKFAATEKTLDACNSFLERAWAAPGSTLRLKDSEWRLEKPEIKRRRHRYFDTPTLLIRQHGGGIRVRDREGDMVFTVKLPVLTSDLRRFEWEQTMPGIHSLEEVTEKHIRQMLLECTTCSSESATTEPCLGALKYLLDANVPLRGVLQLDIRLVVWKLVNPRNRGHVLVSLDRVKVMAEESEVTSFCEIEVESRDECPETDWHSLCRHVETEFGLQDLGKCSKYERALSLIANR